METLNTSEIFKLLSDHCIAALKDLAAQKKELTSESLYRAWSRIPDARSSLESALVKAAPLSSDDEVFITSELEILRDELDRTKGQKEKLLRQLGETEDQFFEAAGFYKSALLILGEMVKKGGKPDLNKAVDRFKKLVREDASASVLHDAFMNVKNAALKDACGENASSEIGEDSKKTDGFFSKLLKVGLSGGRGSGDVFIREIRDAYQGIIDELKRNFGQDYIGKLRRIETVVARAAGIEDFYPVKTELLAMIQDYAFQVRHQRDEAAEFIREIGRRLIDVESQALGSAESTLDMHDSNTEFRKLIEEHLDDLNRNVDISSTLAELKDAVVSKLTTIKIAIQRQSKEDIEHRKSVEATVSELKKGLLIMKKEVARADEKARLYEKELLEDPLTGAYNRRAYDKRLQEEMDRFIRYGRIFSLLLIDVDHFKKINDTYGHAVGDKCLQEIIARIGPALRKNDFLARFGGEEFTVIMPETDRQGGIETAEKLRGIIEKIEFIHKGDRVSITISVGVTQVMADDKMLDSIFSRVDQAMYEAKDTGRNRVVAK